MATFTYTPDYGVSFEAKPNVRVSKMGDGYEQRQANGINSQPKNWTLRFSLRTDAEANAIVSFLQTQAAVAAFDWTDVDGNAGKYVCRSWSKSKDHHNLNTINCQFDQVYEP